MNTIGPVAVEDYLTNVATLAELEKFKKLIADREKALKEQSQVCCHGHVTKC